MKRLLAPAVAVLMTQPMAANAVSLQAMDHGFGGESPAALGWNFLQEPRIFNNGRPAGFVHVRW